MLSPRMPDLASWQVFASVASEGSFGAAARALGVSQQAVSARVVALERQTGVALVDRNPRGSTLTSAGVVVSEWASRLLVLVGQMDTGLAALRNDTETTLHVAASLTIAEYLLPGWLVALQTQRARRQLPPITTELRVVNSMTVGELVRSGEAGLGLVESPEAPQGLRHRTIARDRLIVVAPPSHPWTRRRNPVSAKELAATPLVVREHGSGTRATLADAIKRTVGPTAQLATPALSLSTTTAVRTAVIAGAGPGVLSELAVTDDLSTGHLIAIEVDALDLTRQLRAVWRRTTQPVGPARLLLDIAIQAGRER